MLIYFLKLDILQVVHGRVVYINDGICSQCVNHDCLHVKACQVTLEDHCLPISSSVTIQSCNLHKLSNKDDMCYTRC